MEFQVQVIIWSEIKSSGSGQIQGIENSGSGSDQMKPESDPN